MWSAHPATMLPSPGDRSKVPFVPAARRDDWYARGVGGAVAREINRISTARQPEDGSTFSRRRYLNLSMEELDQTPSRRLVRQNCSEIIMSAKGDRDGKSS